MLKLLMIQHAMTPRISHPSLNHILTIFVVIVMLSDAIEKVDT